MNTKEFTEKWYNKEITKKVLKEFCADAFLMAKERDNLKAQYNICLRAMAKMNTSCGCEYREEIYNRALREARELDK